ncbi:hypothetical protein ACS0TY_027688 [Phlomoides rotata]
MKLMSYNVRGLGGMAKKKEIRKLIKEWRLDGCCIQETKMENMDERLVRRLWGKGKVDWTFKAAEGNSGGILTLWNSEKFHKSSVWETRGMLAINGLWTADNTRCTLINVYAPNNSKHRWELWDNFALAAEQFKDSRVGIITDFNTIREPCDRSGRRQNTDTKDMNKFDDFINISNLTEIKLSGKKFTWYRPDGTCKSKLDRFLVNDEWRNMWPKQVLKGGRRTISDHRPIYLEEAKKDWGLKPFKLFNGWLKKKSFVDLVESKWNEYDFRGWTAFRLKEKLKALKTNIRQWSKAHIGNKEANISYMTAEIQKLDAIDDTLSLEEEKIYTRNQLMKKLSTVMNRREAELIQKAKVRWAKDGNANSALFHRVINQRTYRNNITGL